MKINKITLRLDNLGIIASMLCAIHCAFLPLVITTLPLLGIGFLADERIELSMIGVALAIGILSLGISYFRGHRRIVPILVLNIGFLSIIAGHFTSHSYLEPILIPLGGFTIALSHYLNWRYTRHYKDHPH